MPGKCVVCDGCGRELSLDTKFEEAALYQARERGWICSPYNPIPSARKDYCPECVKNGKC